MAEIKSKLDVDALRSRSVTTPYPHIKIISELNFCVPAVVSALEDGECPLLGTLNGTTKIIKNISKSALNIHKLIRVTDIAIALSPDDIREIKSIEDYMEVALIWT